MIVAQDNSKDLIENAFTMSTADSSHVAVNRMGGWQSLVACLTSQENDSVLFELVVKQENKIDIEQEQLVGRIKIKSLLPMDTQHISFYLMHSIYQLRVESNGNCYLHFESGMPPQAYPFIFPIRTKYKK